MSPQARFATPLSPRHVRLLVASLGAAAALLLASSTAGAQPFEDGEEPSNGDDDDDPDKDADGDGKVDDSDANGDKGNGKEKTEPTAAEAPTDVDALRRRYLELRDKLFRSRARAATVASALYSTSIQIKLDYKSARHYTVTRASIRLDGANVFDDSKGKIADDAAVRFEGFIAPGRHRVTVRIEASGKDDDRFTTASETTFVVIAVASKDLAIKVRAEDGGDIAYKWQRKEKGNYRLSLDVDVDSIQRKDKKEKKKKADRARPRKDRRASR